MKPENFTKINESQFVINGEYFRIEVDGDGYGEYGDDIWVFPLTEQGKRYALYLQIDWNQKTYKVKKAILGEGKNFKHINSTHHQLHRSMYKTMDNFIKFVTETCKTYQTHFKY
jgi:hypothetical protein